MGREEVLNSRPLPYVDDELGDPLTPSQLVIGRRLLSTEESISLELVNPAEGSPTVHEMSRREKYLTTVFYSFGDIGRRDTSELTVT